MSDEPTAGAEQRSGDRSESERTRRLRRFRLLIVLPFAVSALILAPLALLKRTSEVELDLQVTGISFVNGQSEGAGPFFGSVALRSVTISNFLELTLRSDDVEIDDSPVQDEPFPGKWRQIDAGTDVQITSTSDFGALTLHEVDLNELEIPPGARVSLNSSDGDEQILTVEVLGGHLSASAATPDTLLLTCNYCEINGVEDSFESVRVRLSSDRRRVASFRGRENAIADLEVAEGVSLVAHDVPVKEGLDFTRLEGRELVSTIRGGQIVFPEVASEVAIEPRDYVDLKELERFFVRAVELDEGLRVSLHGVVGKLRTGPKGFLADPSPSYLEWLYAQQTWFVYFNAVMLIATTAIGVMKRMKILKEG